MSDSEDNHDVPEYKPSKAVSVDSLLKQDAEDESLRKYKESLLGKVVAGPKDDPRRVVVKEMRVIVDGRPNDIVYPLETKEQILEMKNKPFILKESCHYKIKLSFKVQHEIVSGLKQINSVYRKGIKVANVKTMLGSFGPQADAHAVVIPRNGWEEAPSGLLGRGSYTAKVEFVDDDNTNHLSIDYAFAIKSDWKDTKDE
ncbi:Rho GDP-dissociation inhibitor [Tieghemostelium lacteum]|uniref:Rho GDP-dissociation inhibitor n=1 Tax=Tieghemostelium lacteum TaxID=361077 RepID=A0A152A1I3_TIELA|nr:Rho GDP-dissociation inhibitor [Tieghemostelium lacteum]|eukprot:KYR00108.1 Rho GDP-dissociation inhibitor [Tieghemostelium lacteum]